MAYAQWISVEIQPKNCNVQVKNAYLAWGKFHTRGNKDNSISNDEVNAITVSSGNTGYVYSCGREDSSSGTEGHFDLYDGGTKIGTFYWDCPWGSKRNTTRWQQGASDDYIAQASGGNPDSSAIGNVRIVVMKIA